jgi:prolyl 4-hydroxylase
MGSTPRPLDESWRGWLRLNHQRGCDLNTLFLRAQVEGFDPAAIAAELGGFVPAGSEPLAFQPSPPVELSLWQRLARAPLTDPEHRPRAWRL